MKSACLPSKLSLDYESDRCLETDSLSQVGLAPSLALYVLSNYLEKIFDSGILKVTKPAKAMCASIPSNRRVTLFLGAFIKLLHSEETGQSHE